MNIERGRGFLRLGKYSKVTEMSHFYMGKLKHHNHNKPVSNRERKVLKVRLFNISNILSFSLLSSQVGCPGEEDPRATIRERRGLVRTQVFCAVDNVCFVP